MYPWHPHVDFPEIGPKIYGSAWKVIIQSFMYIYMYIFGSHYEADVTFHCNDI